MSSTGFHQPWDFLPWSPHRTANPFLTNFNSILRHCLRIKTQKVNPNFQVYFNFGSDTS